jgi:hypothetical protein
VGPLGNVIGSHGGVFSAECDPWSFDRLWEPLLRV